MVEERLYKYRNRLIKNITNIISFNLENNSSFITARTREFIFTFFVEYDKEYDTHNWVSDSYFFETFQHFLGYVDKSQLKFVFDNTELYNKLKDVEEILLEGEDHSNTIFFTENMFIKIKNIIFPLNYLLENNKLLRSFLYLHKDDIENYLFYDGSNDYFLEIKDDKKELFELLTEDEIIDTNLHSINNLNITI